MFENTKAIKTSFQKKISGEVKKKIFQLEA